MFTVFKEHAKRDQHPARIEYAVLGGRWMDWSELSTASLRPDWRVGGVVTRPSDREHRESTTRAGCAWRR